MPSVTLGSTPSELNFTNDVLTTPQGCDQAPWLVGDPYADPNNPTQDIRDTSAVVPMVGGAAVKTGDYTAVATDNGYLLVFNLGSAIQLTLPGTIPTLSTGRWRIFVENIGAGTLTVNRNGKNIDGAAANLTVAQNQGLYITTDGTNYFTERVDTSSLATKSGVQQSTYVYAADTGTANAYAVSLSPTPTLVTGSWIIFKAANANTGASTLAVNGGSPIAIKKSVSTSLATGDILANQIVVVFYDGTNFQLLSGAGSSGGSGSGFGGTVVKTADYTAVSGDAGKLIVFNSASAVQLTLPSSPPSATWNVWVENVGAGVLTINRNGLTIDTVAANLTLGTNQGLLIGTDNTNYYTERGDGDRVVVPCAAIAGKPGAGQLVLIFTAYAPMVFPANFATPNSYGSHSANPTATALYTAYKNGVSIGTVSISTGGVYTFATTSGVSFNLNAGDRFTCVAPGTQDATLSDVGITFVGTRIGSVPVLEPPIFTWKGTYSGATAYQPYDVVAYTVSSKVQSYVCILATTGNAPTNTTYWSLVAQAGGDGTNGADGSVTAAQVQQESLVYAADTGTANTYAVSLSPAPTIVAGSVVVFKATNANTGASTLNVNSGGAVAIKKNVSTALAANDILAGQIVEVKYDGTNWQLLGGAGGGNTTAQYVLGKPDATLINSKANSFAYNGPDVQAASPNTMDDEFDDTTGNSGTSNGLNARWSWLNQGVATIAYRNSCAVMDAVANSSNEKAIIQTSPSTPWEVTAKVSAVAGNSNQWAGLVLYDATGGKLIDFFTAAQYGLQVFHMNSTTSWQSQPLNQSVPAWFYNFHPIYLRIKDDGTNLLFSVSYDGVTFIQLYSEGRTSWLANGATRVGLVVNGWTGGTPVVKLTCDWFRRTV